VAKQASSGGSRFLASGGGIAWRVPGIFFGMRVYEGVLLIDAVGVGRYLGVDGNFLKGSVAAEERSV
jgi:hypothetical protein